MGHDAALAMLVYRSRYEIRNGDLTTGYPCPPVLQLKFRRKGFSTSIAAYTEGHTGWLHIHVYPATPSSLVPMGS